MMTNKPKKYRVDVVITIVAHVTVVADDEFDAIWKAKEADNYDSIPEVEEVNYEYAEEIEEVKDV